MTEKPKDKEPKPIEKSTTEAFQLYHNDDADDDVIVIRLDAKDPQRRQIMAAIQNAMEQAKRNDEASRARAYAAEKLPDDWKRKQPARTGDPQGRELRPVAGSEPPKPKAGQE